MKWFLRHKWEGLFLGVMIILGLMIRLLRFSDTFHFYYDQPGFSIKALEIYRTHKFSLIGPPTSIVVSGRQIFQGGIIYLIQLVLLILGRFDPYWTTVIFVIIGGLSVIPLYYGTKWLINRNAAILMSVAYLSLPILVVGTLELWNPNYQLVGATWLIAIMGFCVRKKQSNWLALCGILSGALLQLHYQFGLVIAGILIYYIWSLRLAIKQLLLWICGVILGLSPLIIFELRNNFYNLRTLWLYFGHRGGVASNFAGGIPPHDYQTIVLFGLLAALALGQKYWSKIIVIICATTLLANGFCRFVAQPIQGGIIPNWSYSDELKVQTIVRAQKLQSFNMAMWYDTMATTQKYFLLRDNISGMVDDYQHENYLFVVYPNDDWINDPAYELHTFTPSQVQQVWEINDTYKLYLAKRISETEK